MRRIVCVLGSLILLAVSSAPSEAGPLRDRIRGRQPAVSASSCSACSTSSAGVTVGATCANGTCSVGISATATTAATVTASTAALDEVNAKRAARGLRPFAHDPLLSAAAERCAAFRADRGLFGHTSNDFAFLSGASASAAGCAAYDASYGWMSCCVYDNYTTAGAAWVTGRDGKRYMHLFVR